MSSSNYGSQIVLQNGQYSYLVDLAIQDVWCNPGMDKQHIVAPYRITSNSGALNRLDVMFKTILLPTQGDYYHVFQIGQLHPLILGLLEKSPEWAYDEWISVSDAINQQKLFADIYTANGIHIPRYETYYRYTSDRNLIIAVRENRSIPINYKTDQIYIRVYSNAYFQKLLGDTTEEYIYTSGERVLSSLRILELQNLSESYAVKKGHLFTYVNGYLTEGFSPFNVTVGDVVEFIYDSSISKTVSFTIGDLNNFVSQLDNKQKYLLHYLSDDNDTIDYQDDIDIYLLNPLVNDRYYGVYYHRNSADACRMVTHRDYSVVVQYLVELSDQLRIQANQDNIDVSKLKIELIIRQSGYNRPLIFENNRIQELYKLPESEVLEAMLGTNALVPEWRVENLESCAYTEIMRSESKDININLVQEAFGYNACSMILGNTPSKTYDYSGRKRIDVPRSLTQNATAYEYDQSGKLIGSYLTLGGVYYDCVNPNCAMVEMIAGKGQYLLDVRVGTKTVNVPIVDNYRVYRCHQTQTGLDNLWEDVTGSDFYTVQDGVLTWSDLDFNPFIMVRTDNTFLDYEFELSTVDGNLFFDLTEQYYNEEGYLVQQPLPFPLGELDIFLNDYSVIENVDYIVKFPRVYILNKKYLNTPVESSTQKVHIRFTGFCKSDMTREIPDDQGWVRYGVLSKNNRYDIRDDKVLRIVMGGACYHRDDLKFSETSADLSITNAQNGLPYLIRDIVVPMKNETTVETYAFRKTSEEIDQRISDYLSSRLPEQSEGTPSAIVELYPLMSPFFVKLIHDLSTGFLVIDSTITTMADKDIVYLCKPYEYLLDFDPIRDENGFDFNYVIVHPISDYQVVSLKFYSYQFLHRVAKLYGNDKIDLSSFIMLAPAS